MEILKIQDYLKAYPNGVSRVSRDIIRQNFFTKYGNPYLSEAKWPQNVSILDKAFSALNMLESCFAYNGISRFYEKQNSWQKDQRSYYEQYKENFLNAGGIETDYNTIIEIHKNYLNHCNIAYGVEKDNEGNYYNAIVERKTT